MHLLLKDIDLFAALDAPERTATFLAANGSSYFVHSYHDNVRFSYDSGPAVLVRSNKNKLSSAWILLSELRY